MSYIQKVNDFWAVQMVSDDLGPKEIALYFWLLNVANRLHWPDQFKSSTSKACAALGFSSRSTFTRSRDRLVGSGLIYIVSQGGSSSALYSFEKCDTVRSQPATQTTRPIKEKTDKQREQTDKPAAAPPPLSFSEMLTEAKIRHPKRTDVEEIAHKLQEWVGANGGAFTLSRLNQWIESEKRPKYRKPKPKRTPDEPDGWQSLFRFRYGNEPSLSWSVFWQKYPEDANAILRECDESRSTNCDTNRNANRNTNCDAA